MSSSKSVNIFTELEHLVQRDLLVGLALIAFCVLVLRLDWQQTASIFAFNSIAGTFIHKWVRDAAQNERKISNALNSSN